MATRLSQTQLGHRSVNGFAVDERDATAVLDKLGFGASALRHMAPILRDKVLNRTTTQTDAAAIATAFQLALDDGRPIIVPPGRYYLDRKLTSAGKSVALHGLKGAELRWNAGSGSGFEFTFSDILQTLDVVGLRLQTGMAGGGIGIKATWPDVSSATYRTANLSDLIITSPGVEPGYFTRGIELSGAWLANLDNILVQGQNGTLHMQDAIALRNKCTDAKVSRCNTFFAVNGYTISGFSEGVALSGIYSVFVDVGVNADSGTNAPGLFVSGGHVAAFKCGVNIDNRPQCKVSDFLIYKRPDSAENFIGVMVQGSGAKGAVLHGNTVFGAGAGGTARAFVVASEYAHVFGNSVQNCNADVEITAAGGFAKVQNNHRTDGSTFVVNDATANSFISDNTPGTP